MIYVDDANIKATVGRIRGVWCHLFSWPPDKDELIKFGRAIGLKRKWLQRDRLGWHFDVTESKKLAAIGAGAKEVTVRVRLDLAKSLNVPVYLVTINSIDDVTIVPLLHGGKYPKADLPPRPFIGKEK